MTDQSPESLPPEAELALAWTPLKVRAALTTAFALDRRLARIAARTTEPMLGQMRLAWWRDALGTPVPDRPRGDIVLDAIGKHWAGREAGLIALVDGWEVLVTATPLGTAQIDTFGTQRGAFFAVIGDDGEAARHPRVAAAAFQWALADAATAVSDADERARLVAAGLERSDAAGRLPQSLRGLAVLEALARRALRRGGRPLMEGRGAALVALRAAIFLR